MKTFKAIVPMAILGLAFAAPTFAQDSSSPTAGESMHQAGHEMENAGSDTWSAAKNAGHATATAVRDTDTTARVKMALHRDEVTKKEDIHVTTAAGVVTLTGSVDSHAASARAEKLAEATKGVASVDNRLAVIATTSSAAQ
jgi:hyperosmotically inducible periplasmic protein